MFRLTGCRAARTLQLVGQRHASSVVRHEQQKRDPDESVMVDFAPLSPSYFTGRAAFTDNLLQLEAIARRAEALPKLPADQVPGVSWVTLDQYREMGQDPHAKVSQLRKLTNILSQLNRIEPSVMSDEIRDVIDKFKRTKFQEMTARKPRILDEFGRAHEVGRRKTSVAQVWLVRGQGEALVNGKSLAEYFDRVHDRMDALWPLSVTKRMAQYNIWALVHGGGITGQSEALQLAIAKALLVHEPLLKPILRKANCITRDQRVVERKKTGQPKARKKFTWVKR